VISVGLPPKLTTGARWRRADSIQYHQSRWTRFSTEEEDGQRTSLGTLPGEDASFNLLYSLQRIELTEKPRKNHGRDESWQIVISLEMAELVSAKKSSSGGTYAIILPTGVNVTTAKEFNPGGRENPHFCSRQVCLHAWTRFRNDYDLSLFAVSSQPAHIM